MTPRSRVLNAALLGASIALVLGGAGAFYVGLMRVYGATDCGRLTTEECAFEHDIFKSVGQFQLTFGIGLFALGLAMWVLLRRPSAATTSGEQP